MTAVKASRALRGTKIHHFDGYTFCSRQIRLRLEGSKSSQVNENIQRNDSLQIKIGSRELKDVDHFKYFGSVLIKDGYCTREIKVRIAMAKETLNRKISLLTSKISIELRNKLVRYYAQSIALYGSEIWALRKLERKYLESFEMWCWRRIEN